MIHVAVLLKPYLDLVLSGRKTIECRLTRQARDPYERIEPGDRVYFKQSAGPYAATALAEHVAFESGLTPRRIDEIRRDYNEQVCGAAEFWNAKRHSQFATLIWLTEVRPIDNGPSIRPLQGVAWLCMEEDSAWRRMAEPTTMPTPKVSRDFRGQSFSIPITEGNLRNNSLYVTTVIDQFPTWSIGGSNRAKAGRPVTLVLHDGPTVETDIVGPRKLLRTRVWGSWFLRHGVRKGDRVVFTPINEASFFVGLARGVPK